MRLDPPRGSRGNDSPGRECRTGHCPLVSLVSPSVSLAMNQGWNGGPPARCRLPHTRERALPRRRSPFLHLILCSKVAAPVAPSLGGVSVRPTSSEPPTAD